MFREATLRLGYGVQIRAYQNAAVSKAKDEREMMRRQAEDQKQQEEFARFLRYVKYLGEGPKEVTITVKPSKTPSGLSDWPRDSDSIITSALSDERMNFRFLSLDWSSDYDSFGAKFSVYRHGDRGGYEKNGSLTLRVVQPENAARRAPTFQEVLDDFPAYPDKRA
ncbi:Uncharacterised protein [uncultured archaeon]|nr:Uncharacterised protein [uncultured archaeon]